MKRLKKIAIVTSAIVVIAELTMTYIAIQKNQVSNDGEKYEEEAEPIGKQIEETE